MVFDPAAEKQRKCLVVEVPQHMWEDILDILQDYEVGQYHGGFDLMKRIRQHFDGTDNSD